MNNARSFLGIIPRAGLVLAVLLLIGWIIFTAWPRPLTQARANVVGTGVRGDSEGFMRAEAPVEMVFPRDHGPHPDFQTEWWYYTGNLQAEDGRSFGYQLTFFRRAVLPPAERLPRSSGWAVEQIYLAHFTITDISSKKFHAAERLERGAAGLAGAQVQPGFRVWLHDWSVEQVGLDQYRLSARQDGIILSLDLLDRKGPVLQGDRGYSRKGPEAGNASYYYSLTRLETSGSIDLNGQKFQVTGYSWMDHEYSTSVLSEGQVGWDWFSLQLDNGSELMIFTIRNQDGSAGEYSAGAWVALDGQVRTLKSEDFEIIVQDTWTSPHTGGKYPASWQVRVPQIDLLVDVNPLLPDQELNVSYSYWEGAVSISGSQQGQPVTGRGYVELTGYARSMQGDF